MRFGNGAWLNKEGVHVFSPAQVYFTNISPDEVTLCLPASPVRSRGNTLDGVALSAVISAPYPEVLRIRLRHYLGVREKGPAFPLAQAQSGNMKAEEREYRVIFSSGSLRVEVRKSDAFFSFYRGDELLFTDDGDALYDTLYDYGVPAVIDRWHEEDEDNETEREENVGDWWYGEV